MGEWQVMPRRGRLETGFHRKNRPGPVLLVISTRMTVPRLIADIVEGGALALILAGLPFVNHREDGADPLLIDTGVAGVSVRHNPSR